MIRSKRKVRSSGRAALPARLAALLGWAALCAPSAAQESSQATLPSDLPPYDTEAWLTAAAEREAAWANVEWRQEVLFDLLDGQQHPVHAGTRTVTVRTQPGKTWARTWDLTEESAHTYLLDGPVCLIERREGIGPNQDPEPQYTRRVNLGMGIVLTSRFGWCWDGLPISSLQDAPFRVLDAGLEEIHGRNLRKLVLESTQPSQELATPIHIVWLDEDNTYLVFLRHTYSAINTVQAVQSEEEASRYRDFLSYRGERYGLDVVQAVEETATLAGWARPSRVRLEVLRSGRVESIDASIPEDGVWPADAFALEIPPGARVEEVGAGAT